MSESKKVTKKSPAVKEKKVSVSSTVNSSKEGISSSVGAVEAPKKKVGNRATPKKKAIPTKEVKDIVVRKKKVKKVRPEHTVDISKLSGRVQKDTFGSILTGIPSNDIKRKIPKEASSKVGKRKSSIAKVWIWSATKDNKPFTLVNNRGAMSYFNNSPKALHDLSKPFNVIGEKIDDYCIVLKLSCGGVSSQSEAARLGISKCLLEMMPHMRPVLKKAGLLTRDSRVVEPKKTGLRGARKREQFSKR